jgi:hypothetical protein
MVFANDPRELQSVHPRHHDVGKHKLDSSIGVQQIDGHFGGIRTNDRASALLQIVLVISATSGLSSTRRTRSAGAMEEMSSWSGSPERERHVKDRGPPRGYVSNAITPLGMQGKPVDLAQAENRCPGPSSYS